MLSFKIIHIINQASTNKCFSFLQQRRSIFAHLFETFLDEHLTSVVYLPTLPLLH